ncbi:SLAIN motif-containing protein-like [Pungitius pungitius]|uniref:SLAIN motif-containing protein-like n=1 Tax=Pungitius pungitius TaxID=134920 RepID=UPI002E1076D5
MDLQNQLSSDWSPYFSNLQLLRFNTSANHHLVCSGSRGSPVRLEGHSDPYCSIWKDAEQAKVKSCNNRSFAMEARIRLNNLKSGCNSPVPSRAAGGGLYNYNFLEDLWDREELAEEESALDSVELLDVEDDVRDEESCILHRLYESPKKQESVERSESALGWCRRVLDNPSPEMEAACRSLINRLDQRSSSRFDRGASDLHHNVGCFTDKTSVGSAHNICEGSDMNLSRDSVTASYRLQDITDVHIMARLQEASLRQDYVSMPAWRSPENKTEASSSSCRLPGPSPLSCSPRQSTSGAKHGCESPKLARLPQQVTQFKLLKLAQNQAASPGRTRSPLGTSLRSLQAVRNSRSLDTDDCHLADPPSAPMKHNRRLQSVRESSDRTGAVLRSQSLSPCRIPTPAKGHRPDHGRVFASTNRSTSVAWGRNVPFTRR